MIGAIKTIHSGFTDQTYARSLCAQLSRGMAIPYWLVRDASGRFHPLRTPGAGRGDDAKADLRKAVIDAMRYMGGEILDEYDITGALVKR